MATKEKTATLRGPFQPDWINYTGGGMGLLAILLLFFPKR
jgi:hypothetical protein